jgi:hypothetical protein
MSLTSRLARTGRLALAPLTGFFVVSLKAPKYRISRAASPTFWSHIRRVAREDFKDFFAPFTYVVKEFREELRRGQNQ